MAAPFLDFLTPIPHNPPIPTALNIRAAALHMAGRKA